MLRSTRRPLHLDEIETEGGLCEFRLLLGRERGTGCLEEDRLISSGGIRLEPRTTLGSFKSVRDLHLAPLVEMWKGPSLVMLR
jgi:hypothetical protein